jgi:hypothetical protein
MPGTQMIRCWLPAAAIVLLPGIVAAECATTILPSDRIKDVEAKLECFAGENRTLVEQNAFLRKSNSDLTKDVAAQKTHIAVLEEKSESQQSELKKRPPPSENRERPRISVTVHKRTLSLEECLARAKDWAATHGAQANDNQPGWVTFGIGANSFVISCGNPAGSTVAAVAGSDEAHSLLQSLSLRLGQGQ